jgi:hypothetical protein
MPKAIYINEAAYVEGILVTGVTSLSTALSSEISVRGSADTSLSTAISTLISGNTYDDTSLSTAISTLISGNTYDDTSLSTAISSESSTRNSVDTSLSTNISSNISSVTSLNTAISTEASTRGSADTSLSTAVSSEISVRGNTDTSLSTAISSINLSGITSLSTAVSSEISVRGSADTSLSTVISSEITTRGTADTSLSTSISGVYNNLNLSGLTDVVITTPAESDIIIYSGGTWVNYAPVDGGGVYYSISGGTLYGKAIYNTAYSFSSDNELISKKYVDDLISASGGTIILNYGDNRILTSSGTTKGIVAESNLTFDGTFLNLSGTSSRFRFTDSDTEIWKDGSNNLSFKDSVSGTYTLAQLIGGAGTSYLSGLTDVTISTPINNDILMYSGSTWVNTPNLFSLLNNNVKLASSSHNFYIPSGDYYYLGLPYSEGSWRWFINGNGDLEFQKCVSSVYIYRNIMV